jgi:P-type Cu+ transporter
MFDESAGRAARPRLVSVVAFGCDECRLLTFAAAVAPALEPAIAGAIEASIRERGIQPTQIGEFHESVSTGVAASVDGHRVVVGNAAFFAEMGLPLDTVGDWPERFRRHGEQVLFVSVDGRTAGFLGIASHSEFPQTT